VVQDAGRVGRSSRQADCQSCTSRCSRRRLAWHGVKRAVMIARSEGERRRAVGHLGGLTNSVGVLACPRYAYLHAYVGGKGFKVGKDDTVL